MEPEEIKKLIKLMTEPLEQRLEELERKLELQATEIAILKQGGNL